MLEQRPRDVAHQRLASADAVRLEHAERLAQPGRADVIASDAHRATRPPRLGEALAVLEGHGIRGGEALVRDVPRALLEHGLGALRSVRAA